MSTNKTPNYQLNQWVKTDQVLMDEFNADNSKIDAELNTLSGQVAAKASQSALDTLSSRVTSLSSTVSGKASQSALNSLSNQVAKLGNCQMEVQSYVGSNTYGASSPTRITFKNSPDCFIICGGTRLIMGRKGDTKLSIVSHDTFPPIQLSWSGNQLSIVADSAVAQLNYKDIVYVVLGLHIMA